MYESSVYVDRFIWIDDPASYIVSVHKKTDREVFACVPEEFNIIQFFKPFVVVHQKCAVFSAVEIEKMFKLFCYALNVVAYLFFRKEVSLGAFA